MLIGVLSALLCPNWLFVVSKLGLGPGAIDNTAVGNYVKAAINAFGFSRVCFEGVLGSGLTFGPIDNLLQPPTPRTRRDPPPVHVPCCDCAVTVL